MTSHIFHLHRNGGVFTNQLVDLTREVSLENMQHVRPACTFIVTRALIESHRAEQLGSAHRYQLTPHYTQGCIKTSLLLI